MWQGLLETKQCHVDGFYECDKHMLVEKGTALSLTQTTEEKISEFFQQETKLTSHTLVQHSTNELQAGDSWDLGHLSKI